MLPDRHGGRLADLLAVAAARQGAGPAPGLAALIPLGRGPDLDWHYGPTAADGDPGKMWCRACGREVYVFDGVYMCAGCGRQAGPDLAAHRRLP